MSKYFLKNKFFQPLFYIPLILSFIGIIFIFEASAIRAVSIFGDSLYFLKHQFVWLLAGLIAMVIFSFFDYRRLYFFSVILLGLSFFLLFLVLLPGIGSRVGGAQRWLDFGFFSLQPTELTKFAIIIYLSSWFIYKEKRNFFSFIFLIGSLVFLILLQPDLGTAIIVFSLSIIIYYLAGFNIFNLLIFLPIALVGIYFLVLIAPYRLNRFKAYLNPSLDPQGIGYHINQIMISLSQGDLFGVGLFSSRQKYLYLPEAHTDSIFAIIAEETGFLGSLAIIFLYFVFVYKIYHLIRLAPDKLSKLIASGVFAYFNLHILINLAGMTGLFPLTGVPLPFLSYGGSNLIISYVLIGILLNIEKRVRV